MGGEIVILSEQNINQRLDALDMAYDHQRCVEEAAELADYQPSDVPFDPDRALELMADSGLQGIPDFSVLVLVQEELGGELARCIVDHWRETFRDGQPALSFEMDLVPGDDMIQTVTNDIDAPLSLIICRQEIRDALDNNADIGLFFQGPFWRRV
jgi:hypothetical protein